MLKNKWFQFSLALFVIPFALNLIFYNQLPDVVPTHFDMHSQVDGTMPKFVGLFGMLFFCIALHVFACFVTVKDPKRNNIPDFMMNILFMICPVICIVTNMTIIYFGLGYSFDVGFVMNIIVGVLLIVLGNYLPKVKRNYAIGIKTSWALNSDENWALTNRMGGYCFVVAGILYIVLGLLGYMTIGIFVILAAGIIPSIYSYILFKRGV